MTESEEQTPLGFSSPAEEVAALRAALAEAVEWRSLRSVAREVRMSPTGLRGFLDGAEPYGKTIDKLRMWFLLHGEQKGTEPEFAPETVLGLFHSLWRGMPEQYRHTANMRVLNAFLEGFRRANLPPPQWIAAVRALNDFRRPRK